MLSRLKDGRTNIYVSSATAWEITIKSGLGKLRSPENLEEVLKASRFKPLSITMTHALTVAKLPGHHFDPFDRILVAQAMAEKLSLVTSDSKIHQYDVRLIDPTK